MPSSTRNSSRRHGGVRDIEAARSRSPSRRYDESLAVSSSSHRRDVSESSPRRRVASPRPSGASRRYHDYNEEEGMNSPRSSHRRSRMQPISLEMTSRTTTKGSRAAASSSIEKEEVEENSDKKTCFCFSSVLCCVLVLGSIALLVIGGVILLIVLLSGNGEAKNNESPLSHYDATQLPDSYWSVLRKPGIAVLSDQEHSLDGLRPFNQDMIAHGARAGLQWHTNYQAKKDALSYPANVKFVSMWRDPLAVDFEQGLPNVTADDTYAKVLMGWNQPDVCYGNKLQACYPQNGSMRHETGHKAQAAVERWMALVRAARAKGFTEFVSPTVARPFPTRYTTPDGHRTQVLHHNSALDAESADASTWLPDFLWYCRVWDAHNGDGDECRSSIVYLGTQLTETDCDATNASTVKFRQMQSRIDAMKVIRNFFNYRYGFQIRGTFVTEIKAGNTSSCFDAACVKQWAMHLLPQLMAADSVVAFAWFSYGVNKEGEALNSGYHAPANLFDYESFALNPLGETYFDLSQGPILPHRGF